MYTSKNIVSICILSWKCVLKVEICNKPSPLLVYIYSPCIILSAICPWECNFNGLKREGAGDTWERGCWSDLNHLSGGANHQCKIRPTQVSYAAPHMFENGWKFSSVLIVVSSVIYAIYMELSLGSNNFFSMVIPFWGQTWKCNCLVVRMTSFNCAISSSSMTLNRGERLTLIYASNKETLFLPMLAHSMDPAGIKILHVKYLLPTLEC